MARSSNFGFLARYDVQLERLGALAERFFAEDANTSIIKTGQFAELLAQLTAAKLGMWTSPEEKQADLLRRLRDRGVLTREVGDLFHFLRKARNDAAHDLDGDHRMALSCLKNARTLGVWFHRTVTGDRAFAPSPFIPPSDPRAEGAALKAELERLRGELAERQSAHERMAAEAQAAAQAEADRRLSAEERAARAEAERQSWERLAQEADADRVRLEAELTAAQAQAASEPAEAIQDRVEVAYAIGQGIDLDERETRRLIDAQLRDAGWEADSEVLTHAAGARPQKGRNLAIAEWPTADGVADYALFAGLAIVGMVEAKRANANVSEFINRAERYSRGYVPRGDDQPPSEGPWGDLRVPFLFSTNGRPFLRQFEALSGIWFRDGRHPQNLAKALDGWYTPAGLLEALRNDPRAADARLSRDPFAFNFPLRDYQQRAIRAVEEAISAGRREILVAMATGTGKTKTCIALVYRLLKAQRFRRILFLVDRTALGEQAGNAFKETRMEHHQVFADIFAVKELGDILPDPETKLHIATVQSLVKRVLYGEEPPAIDQYDCIVVDECHRGYLLDREMGDEELSFRSQDDYVSKYRRVLDRFDAVKIGLTATPALHTVEIFGEPVVRYTYQEAVVDGWLVDHDPPLRAHTALSQEGIHWDAGERVDVLDTRTGQLDLIHLDDEVRFDVQDFNRRVLTPDFNRVIAEWLAGHIDPGLPGKTLVFCATDLHADMVVAALRAAFSARYGAVENDAVAKITGRSDDPMRQIRRFKNEELPKVAVTVDLLTTGIDVPKIVNLVFIRRVNSRILYEQMIGRGTRLCEDLFGPGQHKTAFRIFDAVGLYAAMQDLTEMRPVVANPNITFAALMEELAEATGTPLPAPAPALPPPGFAEEEQAPFEGPPPESSGLAPEAAERRAQQARWLVGQIVAKLHRKRRRLSEAGERRFRELAGTDPDSFVRRVKDAPPEEAARTLIEHRALMELLDTRIADDPIHVPLYGGADEFQHEETGYGPNITRPEDYLASFRRYLAENLNRVPALNAVANRPRELTRAQLREVRLLLERDGFGEAELRAAFRDATNADIAASVIGYIRQAALGDPLIPYDERVDRAMRRVLSSQPWTKAQRDWLERIGRQMKKEVIVDREVLDQGEFRQQGGGFARLDRVFDGHLDEILNSFSIYTWDLTA
ncbi:type I restriction-modification system endonuclease [Azospirillum doebereinerae]|uniref:Type I restriction-modification system endonuclease n=1 Tax=Azospirillum doebereinerae TaxID=92933 RepID=A0A433JF16_9PROT|nr:type I restriction-modification system endonuclease [Azospirillum doebereinerae]RUQ75756.1 type I restriction-modification system endonuclease [Azospirillum doebereinerae]